MLEIHVLIDVRTVRVRHDLFLAYNLLIPPTLLLKPESRYRFHLARLMGNIRQSVQSRNRPETVARRITGVKTWHSCVGGDKVDRGTRQGRQFVDAVTELGRKIRESSSSHVESNGVLQS